MKLKLIHVLREAAARMFQCNLATKEGKRDFAYISSPHPYDYIFQHRPT